MTSTEPARCRVIAASASAERARGCGDCVRMTRGGARKQQAGDFVDGFVAHGAVDKMDSAAGELLVPESDELARAGRIVRAVQVDRGPFLQPFETAGPAHLREATRDGGVIHGEAALGEQARCGDGRERVAHLEAAGERQARSRFARVALPG